MSNERSPRLMDLGEIVKEIILTSIREIPGGLDISDPKNFEYSEEVKDRMDKLYQELTRRDKSYKCVRDMWTQKY